MAVIFFLYRFLQILGSPLIVLYFAVRGIRDARYLRCFRERLGYLPEAFRESAGGAVWVHAVSVGEVISAIELLRRARARFPASPLYVSVGTVAGRAVAEQKLAGLADGVFYAPIDYCFAVRRVLRTIRPKLLVVLETELWPNLFRETRHSGCGLVILNGRISDRAWPRYRALRRFFRPVLQLASAILVQNEISRSRFVELGAPAERVRLGGNLKYDFDPRRVPVAQPLERFFERIAPAQFWIAASTMPPAAPDDTDEDDVVIEAFTELARAHPDLLLVLAPRKPERFETAAQALARAGVRFLRRSALGQSRDLPALPGVLLLDSIGELGALFRFADVVFMGGTLARRGGHNPLEPAFFSKPVVAGPHMENFPDIAAKFSTAGAVVEIPGPAALAGAVDALLRDQERRSAIGARALSLAEAEQGATARALEQMEQAMAESLPCRRAALPARVALWPLSRLWLAGSSVKQRVGVARRRRLDTPVISIGGLTAGGAGKSPTVLWLLERLAASGHQPAVLTRGYRRKAGERITILAAGARALPARTGDEAQEYLRSGLCPVGISADRWAAGRLIEERFQPGVFLLDDGFQHWRLERSLDIVVLDALDPFGGGEPLPLGRLRERLETLGRAGAIVLTRCEGPAQALEREIRRYNTAAPIFRARLVAKRWVDAATGETWNPTDLPFTRPAAFCGLGNPASYWRSLAELGVRPAFRRRFPDHHAYSRRDLVRLAARARSSGAEALLTTGKDAMNLCEGWQALVAPLRICRLEIGLEIEQGDALLRMAASFSSRLRVC